MRWTALMAGTTRSCPTAWQTAWRPEVRAESPGKQQKCAAGKWRCSPRGGAALRPGLLERSPGGVLKCGCPGSDGEPGCGPSRLRAWHAGGGPRLPGSAWRARQNGCFLSTLRRLYTRTPAGSDVRGRSEPSPPPFPRGLHGFGWRAGFPL